MFPNMGGDYSERLTLALRMAGVSRAALARELEISYQAVKKVLDGKSASFSALNNDRAARFLRVSSRWLATGEGDSQSQQDMRLSPLALDLALMLDAIKSDEQRQKAYALCVQVLQFGAAQLEPAPPAPAPQPSKKLQPHR
jgi:transcriptional regulator with XRE-family HTH domain